jgi:hypothetical protein
MCFCNVYLASSVWFSSLGFLLKPGKCSSSSTSAAITYSTGWKEEEQVKAGEIKKTISERFWQANRAENWGSGC